VARRSTVLVSTTAMSLLALTMGTSASVAAGAAGPSAAQRSYITGPVISSGTSPCPIPLPARPSTPCTSIKISEASPRGAPTAYSCILRSYTPFTYTYLGKQTVWGSMFLECNTTVFGILLFDAVEVTVRGAWETANSMECSWGPTNFATCSAKWTCTHTTLAAWQNEASADWLWPNGTPAFGDNKSNVVNLNCYV
jgi:hypothetical protein